MTLADITVFDFKNCYNGDLSSLDNISDWDPIFEQYEEKTKSNSSNLPLELQKQIAIKENDTTRLKIYLFVIEQSFQAYISSQDEYWINSIIDASKEMKTLGIVFNTKNEYHKEFKRCIKLVKNKQNDIKQDLEMLNEATKGSMTFSSLITIVGKFQGGGFIKQKEVSMEEFCDAYNLMGSSNGK